MLVHRPKLVAQFLVPLCADVAPLVLQLHAAAAGLKYISDLFPMTHTEPLHCHVELFFFKLRPLYTPYKGFAVTGWFP